MTKDNAPDAQQTTTAPRTPGLGRYEIDVDGSSVTFRTRHLFGLLPVRGSFAIRSGTADVVEPLVESRVRAEIDAASFDTGTAQRDRTVRSALFLDAGRFPVFTFASDRLDGTTLTGVLTVRDVTHPVSLTVDECDVSARSFTARATTRMDRTAFGVTASRGMTGRYLDVSLEVRCVRV